MIKKIKIITAAVCAILCITCGTYAEKTPEELPIYSAEFLDCFSTDSIDRLCELLFPSGYSGDEDYQSTQIGDNKTMYSLHRYGDTARGAGDLSASSLNLETCTIEFRVRHGEGEVQYDYNDTVLKLDGTPYGCAIKKEEAVQKAGELAEIMNSGLVCSGMGKMQGEIIGKSFDTARSKDEAYYLVFSRGDPLPLVSLSINSDHPEPLFDAGREEFFRITITDEGVDSFVYSNPVRSAQQCGMTKVISAKEAMKAAKQDITKERKDTSKPRKPDEMVLGYYLCFEEGKGYSYIPVWCYYDRKSAYPDDAASIIRADTGEPIH